MAYAHEARTGVGAGIGPGQGSVGRHDGRAEAAAARADAARTVAEERLALLTAAAALAEERAALLTAAATRAESAEKQLGLERREHDLAAKHTVRLELRVQALKRRRERLQAELCKFQDQLARADVSGSIRELQEEKAQLQQRLADLQTYFTLRVEPPQPPPTLPRRSSARRIPAEAHSPGTRSYDIRARETNRPNPQDRTP